MRFNTLIFYTGVALILAQKALLKLAFTTFGGFGAKLLPPGCQFNRRGDQDCNDG
jgi:hypothetical protein